MAPNTAFPGSFWQNGSGYATKKWLFMTALHWPDDRAAAKRGPARMARPEHVAAFRRFIQ